MMTLQLIHWNEADGRECAERLASAGYRVRFDRIVNGGSLKAIRADPPDACVIDLSRLPSHGREVAVALRQSKATRAVPLVFVDGAEEKVQRVRQALPDATFTTWPKIRSALKAALAKKVVEPIVPKSISGIDSGVPLVKKVGIKAGSTVNLLDPPDDVETILGALPEGVRLVRGGRGKCDMILWFVRSRRDLARRIGSMAGRVGTGNVWIIWPKKTSALAGDLAEPKVREAGLAAGLVDFKICAVDATWSGLRFAVRRRK